MKKIIRLHSNQEAIQLYGNLDERLRFAEIEFHVRIAARNNQLMIEGEKESVSKAADFFKQALRDVRSALPEGGRFGGKLDPVDGGHGPYHFFHKGKLIKPRSHHQEIFLKTAQQFDIVIAIGPAGTGKTYLAMALALDALKKKQADRIILTRPAVEAGESLGFLPGDLQAKINPYLRPLYDALYDMMDYDEVARHIQRGIIEVAPLAYMRGRSLNHAFIILDEGQNCTYQQLKMFFTRLGIFSKMIVTGDITQIDLPNGKNSGLLESQKILKDVDGIKFVHFDETDVVRHRLVQAIIKAYEAHEKVV